MTTLTAQSHLGERKGANGRTRKMPPRQSLACTSCRERKVRVSYYISCKLQTNKPLTQTLVRPNKAVFRMLQARCTKYLSILGG